MDSRACPNSSAHVWGWPSLSRVWNRAIFQSLLYYGRAWYCSAMVSPRNWVPVTPTWVPSMVITWTLLASAWLETLWVVPNRLHQCLFSDTPLLLFETPLLLFETPVGQCVQSWLPHGNGVRFCWKRWSRTSITPGNVNKLSLPNEDFGRRNKRCNPDFLSTFQGC